MLFYKEIFTVKARKWWKTESKTKTFASFGSHCRLQGRLFALEGSARSYVREERIEWSKASTKQLAIVLAK